MNKILGILALAFVAFLVALSGAKAQVDEWNTTNVDIKEMTVYVDGVYTWHGVCDYNLTGNGEWNCSIEQLHTPALERGKQLEVKVIFIPAKDIDSRVTVEAEISGYREDIEDEYEFAGLIKEKTYTTTLYLDIPMDLEADEDQDRPYHDNYTLYVRIKGKTSLDGVTEAEIGTTVQRVLENLEIEDVEISGSEYLSKGICGECYKSYLAGEICDCVYGKLYVDVVLKNRGNYKLEDVYVKASIPELCLEKKVYVGDIMPTDDDDDNEDVARASIVLTLPENTREGEYEIVIEAYNDDVYEKYTKTISIKPVEKEEEKEVEINAYPQISKLNVKAGEEAVFSLLLTNEGTTQTATVEVLGTETWATYSVEPSAVTLSEGESRVVYIKVTPKEDAVEGEHVFTVKVRYGNEYKTIQMSANIIKGTALDLKTILMIIGIVLAIIVVILLIVLLAKGTPSEEKAEETYY